VSRVERQLLQILISAGSLVPIVAGLVGLVFGPAGLGTNQAQPIDFDSHFRYLSGLLLAVGCGYLSTVPKIERHSDRFIFLTLMVVAGGSGRFFGVMERGVPSMTSLGALLLELLVAPALALWVTRVAHRAANTADRLEVARI
jgi:hypothetical protein